MKSLFLGLFLASIGTLAIAQPLLCEAMFNRDLAIVKDYGASLRADDKTFSNGRYRGTLHDGRLCGKGGYFFDSGQVQYGHWSDGKLVSGTKIFNNGSVRVGTYKSDGTFQDTAEDHLEKYSSGALYYGRFKNNKRSGKGVYLGEKGSVYAGEFLNGKYHGDASYCPASREFVYHGNFENGKRHGAGRIRYKNGTRYQGVWRDGKIVFGLGIRNGKDSIFYIKNGKINSRRPKGWCADNGYGQGISDQCVRAISRRAKLDNDDGEFVTPSDYKVCDIADSELDKKLTELEKWVETIQIYMRPN